MLKSTILMENIRQNSFNNQFIANARIAYQPHFMLLSTLWLMLEGYYGPDDYNLLFTQHRKALHSLVTRVFCAWPNIYFFSAPTLFLHLVLKQMCGNV